MDDKLGFRPKEAASMVGSLKLLDQMVNAGWLKPVIKRHKLTLYSRADIEAAFARLQNGEYPEVKGGV